MANYIDDAHPELTDESLKKMMNTSSVPLTEKVNLESLANLFKVPETTTLNYGNFGEAFEKYKLRIELLKWLVGTIGLTVITFIINWGFRDREQGMNEISQYDKYASELIILNDNPVNRRMLAQFFSKVIPSEKLKKGWVEYYKEVDSEYRIFMQKDSLVKYRLGELTSKDSNHLSQNEKKELFRLQLKSEEFDKIKLAPTIAVGNALYSTQTIYVQCVSTNRERAEQIKSALSQMGFKLPSIEYMNREQYKLKDNEIRYFRESDYSGVEQVKNTLKNINIEAQVKYIPNLSSKTQAGTIELWLK